MAKTDNIRQIFGKNEKICRNLLFSRNLFVYLHRIVCLSCAIGEKDGTNILVAQFLSELLPRKERRAIHYHIEVGVYAQTSTYVVMGCSKPGQEYGEVCAIFMSIS